MQYTTRGRANPDSDRRAVGALLWSVQGLLAALFLFAGIMKLIMPIEAMNQGSPIQMPGMFLRFIGVAETLGGLGLVLPGLLSIKRMLTPLAAIGPHEKRYAPHTMTAASSAAPASEPRTGAPRSPRAMVQRRAAIVRTISASNSTTTRKLPTENLLTQVSAMAAPATRALDHRGPLAHRK